MRFLVTFILVFSFSELQINANGSGKSFETWSDPLLNTAFSGNRAQAGNIPECSTLDNSNFAKSCLGEDKKQTTYGKYMESLKAPKNNEEEIDSSRAASQCESAYKQTRNACNGIVFSSQVIPMITAFTQAKSANNVKEMCEKAAAINTAATGLNLAFALRCQSAQKRCVSACENTGGGGSNLQQRNAFGKKTGEAITYDDMLDYCENKQLVAQLSMYQVAVNATQAIGSKTCADMASGKCVGNDSFDDEDCVQFCQKPGRQTHPKCAIAMNSCNDATFASQNAQLCECLSNPMATNCGFTMPVVDLDNSGNYNDPFANLDLPNPYEYGGNNPTGNRSGVEGGGGGGGGFGGGGGGSAPFGQNDGNYGGGDEELNKDILGGQSSGSGMPIGGGSGGYESSGGSGGSGRARGSSGGDGLGFDLRAFLPGGKKDPKRGLASNGYADQSITEANGLTNFQKITRKLNQKKVELTP